MSQDEFDVVVVGAGAAGLAAAQRLKASGLSCVVIEARDRPGGRAWTTRLANGVSVDLGCEWLHSADANPLVAIAEAQGCGIDRSPPPWSRPRSQIGPNRERMVAFWDSLSLFRERVEAFADGRADVACDALLTPGDANNDLVDAVSTFYSGAELAKVSAVDLAIYEDTGVNWRVREGYGTVIAALADDVAVRYGCAARAIDHSAAHLSVETDHGALHAHAAIVTLPSNVLAETPAFFRPALPEKTSAAHDLPLGLANKLYLELLRPEAFEPDSRAFGGWRRATGAYHIRPLGRPIIEGFYGGECAESLEQEGAAAAFALDELAGLFGADIRAAVRPTSFHGWRGDPFARGAYSYARPGCAESRQKLAEPVENRLFFAGEATSRASFSTAHGAYATGVRAAEAALRALRP